MYDICTIVNFSVKKNKIVISTQKIFIEKKKHGSKILIEEK